MGRRAWSEEGGGVRGEMKEGAGAEAGGGAVSEKSHGERRANRGGDDFIFLFVVIPILKRDECTKQKNVKLAHV